MTIPGASSLLVTLTLVSVKVAWLVVLGAVTAWGLGRASATLRHALWSTVMAGVVVIVIFAAIPSAGFLPISVPPLIVAGPGSYLEPHRTTAPTSGVAISAPVGRSWAPRASDALILVWVIGAAILALRLALGKAALVGLVARARSIENGSQALRRHRVRLIETDELSMPATWGAFRPVIALPSAARAWSGSQRLLSLRHELAHVRRHDEVTRTGADLCCALLWFHPGVWFAARRMRAESERACDDAVLAAGNAGVGYAELLLALAGRTSPSMHAMADARELEGRLRAILDPSTSRSTSRPVLAALSALMILVAAGVGGVGLRASTPAVPGEGSLLDERVPMTDAQVRHALERNFLPRNTREAGAFGVLSDATRHVKQHEMDLIRERAIWALSVADVDQVVAPLVSRLADDDWRVRAYAAWTLGAVGSAESLDALAPRLSDPVWRVRSEAAFVFARLADVSAVDPMIALLDDPAWQVRLAAVEYLTRVKTPRSIYAVREHRTDAHAAVRSAAQAALGE